MERMIDLSEATAPLLHSDPGRVAYARFDADPDLLVIPVVNGDRVPVGLVERTRFALKMAGQFGREVFAGRPVSLSMDSEAVVIDGEMPLTEFISRHLQDRPAALLKGFVVTRGEVYAGVGTALSLLQAQNARISAQAADAQAALRAKSEFLAVMSHEIRTPLNGVLTLADVLQRQMKQDDLRPHVGAILESGRTLLRLLNDALDLSRAEGGGVTVELAPFQVAGVLDDIEMLWRPRALESGLRFITDLDAPDDMWVLGDVVRLKQIINNLVGNALKFTRWGEVSVHLTARRDGAEVNVTGAVVDSGPGIAEHEMPRLFTPFGQTESGRKAGGGAGLGLTICRELARGMGGDITVESREGHGSTFTFDVRLAAFEEACRPAEPDPEGHEEDGIAAHVLIVDDNATNRLVAETLLSMVGCSFESAADGAEAVSKAAVGAFDLILMDVKMPVMDGIEATRRIRQQPRGALTPIIALTANADPNDALRYRREGLDDVVEKPIQPERLFAAMSRALEAPVAADPSRASAA